MGQAKREHMRQEEMCEIAEELAIETGLLDKCEAHGYIISTGEVNTTSTYKYANSLFSKNSTRTDIFKTRTDLTDKIKEVVEDHGTTCPGCAKVKRE